MSDLFSCPRTAFLPAGIDACALYRMFMPHLRIEGSMFLFRMDRLRLQDLNDYQVVVVQRQGTDANLKAMKLMKRAGKKVVYDLDDNLWNIPAANPGKQALESLRQGFSICAAEADLITVSTQGLKSAMLTALPGLKAEILVTPNGMDFDFFSPCPLEKEDGKILLGWAGSNTHGEDIRDAWSVMPDLINRHEKLWIEFVGMPPPKEIQNHPRAKYKPWVPVGEFPNRLSSWSWDISMAPLVDNRFNRSKSCIKALESAALKIPCLMSNVQPYREFCALGGKELEWLLCDSKRDWEQKLERLVVDTDYRKWMGELTYNIARKYFDMENLKNNWMYALRKAAGQC